MEQGSLRCDVNVSLRPVGQEEYGVKVEMKNINSFKAIERAIRYEIKRQTEILNAGGTILPETRRFDDAKGESFSMRTKEGAKDYRYMPEPDISKTIVSDEMLEDTKRNIPPLPNEIKSKLMEEYGLNEYDANLIAKSKEIYTFFFDVAKCYDKPKKIANWITSEINKKINSELMEEVNIPVDAIEFAKMLNLLDDNQISQAGARTILLELWGSQKSTEEIIEEMHLRLENNDDELEKIIEEIIKNNEKCVNDYKNGNQKAFAFFVGQVMKATKGQANATTVNEMLKKHLS